MGKKHSIINYCYRNCNECQRCKCYSWRGDYKPLYAKIKSVKRNGSVDHLSIEEFRLEIRHQPKGVSADKLALKDGLNPSTAYKLSR